MENRSGAAGNLATAAVAKAAPDGYTLLMIHSTSTINATLYDNLDFDFVADIAPVATLFRDAMMVVVVNPSFPAKTLPEFISYAKLNPGKVNMGSSGVGTRHMSTGSFSSFRPASTLCTCRTAASPKRSRIYWEAK